VVTTEQQPTLGVIEVTPNGLPIYFQYDPRRYRLGPNTGPDQQGTTWEEVHEPESWEIVPSVSEVLDVLHKPGLPWWGQGVAIEGVQTLHGLDLVREIVVGGRPMLAVQPPGGWQAAEPHPASVDEITALLTQNQLTVNHVRDRAGDRGLAVHDALEGYADTGRLPDPTMYAATEAGYIRALVKFLRDVQPEPIASEVMVASREFGYAGRYDFRFRVSKPRDVVARCYPKKSALVKRLQPGEILSDLKSSKGVYESHPRQLEGYEKASTESGWDETSARGIIHVQEDGQYEFVRSWADFNDFLAVLMVWRSDQAMKKRKKELA